MLRDMPRVSSDDLEITSINDLCCYLNLLLIASRADAPQKMRRDDPISTKLRGVRIRFDDEGSTDNKYMTHRRFVVVREGA